MVAHRAFNAIDILMVEDNPGDVRLTREALKEGRVLNQLHTVEDGVAALDYLNRRPPYEQATRPDLILLDLNLPKMHGHDVLAAIRSSEDYKAIPVVILTTSHDSDDVARSYHLGANCHIRKPADLNQFNRIVQTIEVLRFDVADVRPAADTS